MLAKPLLSEILDNDAVTRGLADPEARILVEWLVDRTEQLAESTRDEAAAQRQLNVLCQRARAFRHFVDLWCYQCQRGAAGQFAAAERFGWPLPCATVDPC